MQLSCPFRVLKKWRQRLCWGPGARPERAGKIGWVALCPRGSKLVSAGGGGGSQPRPIYGDISALYSKRAGLAPGPWNPLALMTNLCSKN